MQTASQGLNVPLHQRVALVTGAESGIGAACSVAFARAGASVAVSYLKARERAEAVVVEAKKFGCDAASFECDVTDESAVESLLDAVNASLGRPDLLLNSAGLNQSGVQVADMPLNQWRRLLATDLTGAFLTCRRFVRDLRNTQAAGVIINISSIHENIMRAGAADYASAKGGLRNLTRTLALECAPLIRVNDIAPGMILTPMNARAEVDAEYRAKLEASIPLRRAGHAEEVAQLAVFLASPAASYITGGSFVIDGGLSLVLGQGA